MKERLFRKFDIDQEKFRRDSEGFGSQNEENLKILDCGELYTNRCQLTQIDDLAKEIFGLFSNLKKYITNKDTEEDSLDFSAENLDKVGYLFNSDQMEFGKSKVQGNAISDKIQEAREKDSLQTREFGSGRLKVNGSSTNMTSTISNSKVRAFPDDDLMQVISLNENLARDNSKRNVVKSRVRAKWIPNEHAEE